MKKNKVILSLIFIFFIFCFSAIPISFEIDKNQIAKQKSAMQLAIVYMPKEDAELQEISNIIAKTLSYSKQFGPTVKNTKQINSKNKIKRLFDKGFSLAIFLNKSQSDKNSIEWRLYDTFDSNMVCGKKLTNNYENIRHFSYNISDQLWQALTGQKSSFYSKLAYIKKNNNKKSIICTSDFDGSNEKIMYSNPGIYLGLYWANNSKLNRLICSEFTRYNVRLISIEENKKNILLDLNGTCVGVSMSPDNNQAVYCRSGDIWYHKYFPDLKRSLHTKLISNDGKNLYPILLQSGDLVFCSDSRTLRAQYPKAIGPQICYFKTVNKSTELITTDGYCIAPSYCGSNNKLAYSKKINGYFQIFIYDFKTQEHKQITFSKSDKVDTCWSPCGNHIAFCIKRGPNSQIATINLKLNTIKIITPCNVNCSSPAWSYML